MCEGIKLVNQDLKCADSLSNFFNCTTEEVKINYINYNLTGDVFLIDELI